jgi:BirA family biotin operon repressor/biotin-[acetyl-CoA-carboxylase] ligase
VDPEHHVRRRDDEIDWPPGWHVREVAETGSTNADLLAEADTAPDRTVLRADHQTAGRGRLDRRWDAPPGANLLVSVLFRHPGSDPGELLRRVAIAVAVAANEIAGLGAVLKWPNDVLVDGRKLAGILAQRSANGAVVVGAGVNVGWAPDGAARIGDHDPRAVLAAVLRAFDALPADVGSTYRAMLATIGQRVRVELPAGVIEGRAVDVETDGRLVVIDDCAISHRVAVGDVVHLRPA